MNNTFVSTVSAFVSSTEESMVRNMEILKVVAPGLWLAGYKFLIIKDGKVFKMLNNTPTEDHQKEEGLKVELSEAMLEELKNYQKPAPPKKLPSTYMFTGTPFPVFAKMLFEKEVDPNLSGLIKVIDTKDPVSLEELTFVDAEFWKEMYEKLKNICVDVCPNGHALSFDTLCNFMNDDGWTYDQVGEICKVKCPCCRKRFQIHDTLPLLCNFFTPIVEAETAKADKDRSKEDNISTYFSTMDDEDDDDLEEVRRMVENEEEDEEAAEEEAEEGDDDEEEFIDDEEDDDEEEDEEEEN